MWSLNCWTWGKSLLFSFRTESIWGSKITSDIFFSKNPFCYFPYRFLVSNDDLYKPIWKSYFYSQIKKSKIGQFPDGPVVKTLCFHCQGHGFDIWWGNWHPTSCMVWPKQTNKTLRYKWLQTRQTSEGLPLPRVMAACGTTFMAGKGKRVHWTPEALAHCKSWDLVVSRGFSLKLDLPVWCDSFTLDIYLWCKKDHRVLSFIQNPDLRSLQFRTPGLKKVQTKKRLFLFLFFNFFFDYGWLTISYTYILT